MSKVVSTDLFLESCRSELESVNCEDPCIQHQKVNARFSLHLLSESLNALQVFEFELKDRNEVVCVCHHIAALSGLGDFLHDCLTPSLHISGAHDDSAARIGESLAGLEPDARVAARYDRDLACEEISLPLGVVLHHLLGSRLLPELGPVVAHG